MKCNWKVSVSVLLLAIFFLIVVFTMLDTVDASSYESAKGKAKHTYSNICIQTVATLFEATGSKPFERELVEVPQDKVLIGKDLYISYIYEIHRKYYPNLDPVLVQAVMQLESNYEPSTISHCGAVGLMQVIPKYHSWRMYKYGLTDIWDPYTNIVVGMDFLNESYMKYGSYYAALRAYGGTDRYAKYVLFLTEQIRQGGG